MVLVSRDIVRADSLDSAAAIVTISAPHSEKITVVTPARTDTTPNGAKPPCAVRFPNDGPFGEGSPSPYAPAIRMKITIAATLIDENQNSNSPYERDDSRFTAVSASINASPNCHTGRSIHVCSSEAPAIASIATTTTKKYQYSQPLTKPAQSPSPRRMYSVNEPRPGAAAAISLSI